MKRILFAVLPEKGHVNPYIGPGQALRELGYEVAFTAPADLSAQLGGAGLEFDPRFLSSHPPDQPMRGKALVDLTQNSHAMAKWVEELLLDGLDEQVDTCRRALSEKTPDVIVVDPLYYAAALASESLGIPWISVSNSLNPCLRPEVQSDLLNTLERLKGKREAIFKRWGVRARFSGCDVLSPLLTIAFTTQEFVGPAPSGVVLTGPSIPLAKRGDEDESFDPTGLSDPLIYASFGSQIYHQPDLFLRIIEACEGLPLSLVLSIGDLMDDSRFSRLPDFCRAYRYAPQLSILKRASLFISHGGANSVMESLQAGVPLLVSPMCNDQYHQGHFVRESGVGSVMDLRAATASKIRKEVLRLLESPSTAARVWKVSESYRRDGAREAARAIDHVIRRLQVR